MVLTGRPIVIPATTTILVMRLTRGGSRDAVPSSLDHRLKGKGRSNTIMARPTASHSGFNAMFAKRHETNRLEQSCVRLGGRIGSDLTRRGLLRSVAQGVGWLSLPLVVDLQPDAERGSATRT